MADDAGSAESEIERMVETMRRWKSRETLIDELINELAPAYERLDEVMVAIERDQKIISTCRSVPEGRTGDELRAILRKYLKALNKLRSLTDGLGARDRSMLFRGLPAAIAAVDASRFLAELDRLIDVAEYYATGAIIDPGNNPWDPMKYASALRAYYLVRQFSQKRPSRARDGVTARVAALLYELAAGRRPTSISDYLVQDQLLEQDAELIIDDPPAAAA
jgi:hypothetical protein